MIKNSKKGVSLYLTIIILTILLTISLGVSSILVGQMKVVGGIGDSVIAFYAADSGIEKILYLDEKNCRQNCTTSTAPVYCSTNSEECTGLVTGFSTSSSVDGTIFNVAQTSLSTFKSVGKYREVRRAIEVTR